ncbi:MAG: MG2 domain-containing protein, partial [Planctomycetota bacterium]
AMVEVSLFSSAVRTRRANEAVKLLVTARNIEELEVEIYELDLEAYFLKHATYEHVEQLDLDLIAPNQRFEHEIEDYEPYALHEIELTLPVEGPGTWVAVVRGENLYSTTLVRRSDLEMIVHGTAEEALVWVEDTANSAPAAGARVLLSQTAPDGTQEWTETLTDDRGIARFPLGVNKGTDKIGVLAERDGHTASSGLALRRTVARQELTPRGVLTTDRSIYRPGETVSWRAVVRDTESGRFVTPAGRSMDVDLIDPRGRKVDTRSLPLSEFGTAHGTFELPQSRVFGSWKLAGSVKGIQFVQSFELANFELRHTELLTEVERDVVFRGEEVVCHFTAQQYWGSPAQGMPLRIELPDGQVLNRTTDEEGRVTVRFNTRDFASARTLLVRGTLESEGIEAEARVRLA